MSKQHDRITQGLVAIGACWAVTSSKTILPNDGYDAKPTYHIHPDCSYPHEDAIKRFDTLKQLMHWISLAKQATPNDEIVWNGENYELLVGAWVEASN